MEELLGQVISVLKGMWKHRWPAMAVAWIVAAAGIVFVLSAPDKYEASARIFVDTQSILRPLMAGLAIQPNVDQQVAMLSRMLISRSNVEKLIRMADLDLGNTTKKEQDALVSSLAGTLQIANAGNNLYVVSFRDANPDRAKRVVQALVSIFVESSIGQTRKDSGTAKQFVEDQIKNYRIKLEEAETRLKEFKIRNIDLNSAEGKDMGSNLQAIYGQLSQARLELREAENSRESTKRQIEAEKTGGSTNLTMRSLLQESNIKVSTPEIDSRIAAQKSNLDGLLQRFTEQHPDVINVRKLIKELEEQKRKEAEELRKNMIANPTAPGPTSNAVLEELGRMLAASEARVAALQVRVSEYETRAGRAREQLKTGPQLEIELTQLNRDYGIHLRNYQDLVQRRETAGMTIELEGQSSLADFRLIEPPRASDKPVAPNRLLLLPMALAAALAAGLGIAFVLSQLKAVFFDARAVRNTIGLPVLGVVTLVLSGAARVRERKELKWFGVASSGLIGMFVICVVFLTIRASRAG